MPYLNLHLTSDKPIAKQDLTNLKSKWTQKQLLALETWLLGLNHTQQLFWTFTKRNVQLKVNS